MTPALGHTPVLMTERLVLRAPVAGDWPQAASFIAPGNTRSLALAQRLSCQRTAQAATPAVEVWRHPLPLGAAA